MTFPITTTVLRALDAQDWIAFDLLCSAAVCDAMFGRYKHRCKARLSWWRAAFGGL